MHHTYIIYCVEVAFSNIGEQMHFIKIMRKIIKKTKNKRKVYYHTLTTPLTSEGEIKRKESKQKNESQLSL